LAFYNWVNTNDDLTIGNLSCWKQETSSLGSDLNLNTGSNQNRTVKSFESLDALTNGLISVKDSSTTASEWEAKIDFEKRP
jgi:hypothetical protein